MSPETQARQQIDDELAAARWLVQDMKQLNPGAALGLAVRERPTDTGPADYVLLVDQDARLRPERAVADEAPVRRPSKSQAAAQTPA